MRKFFPFILVGLLIAIGISTACSEISQKKKSLRLWYKSPLNSTIKDDISTFRDDPEWLKALPLGNGS